MDKKTIIIDPIGILINGITKSDYMLRKDVMAKGKKRRLGSNKALVISRRLSNNISTINNTIRYIEKEEPKSYYDDNDSIVKETYFLSDTELFLNELSELYTIKIYLRNDNIEKQKDKLFFPYQRYIASFITPAKVSRYDYYATTFVSNIENTKFKHTIMCQIFDNKMLAETLDKLSENYVEIDLEDDIEDVD